ncbi:GNAT family N-acetyltransferase [Halobaculum lipolyticum]|uniref:GNAT family N-acetyltransferase n=1 Tax=Halobaculum lipolyticum TaxID=3032001 RepID=A0ABD5WDQ0_9EURY|nr:GNAT family N-acetyltransferase [Halobaculum sp. DT31]
MTPALRFREAADAADVATVERLLAAADLPTDDVRAGAARFVLATPAAGSAAADAADAAPGSTPQTDPDAVAVGGLEAVGDAALLRSVAVSPGRRGEGVGSAMVAELERRAAADGVAVLVLLTTDAAGFFAAHGYERIDRAEIPAALRSTPQVASLCPDSATVLCKRL